MARVFNRHIGDTMLVPWHTELGRMMLTVDFVIQAGHVLMLARRAKWWILLNVSKYWHSAMLPLLNYGETESAQRRRILWTRSNEPQIGEPQP
jgi:hypothetical protein